jgi:hypothetical protein
MSIPSLPTDNLYKFMALAGLVMIALSTYYPMQRISDLELKQVSTNTGIGLAQLEADEISKEVSRLEKKKTPDHAAVHSLDFRQLQSQQTVVRLHGLMETQQVLLAQLRRMLILGGIGLIVGTVLSWYGFRLWYERVQRPLDSAVANSAADT